MKINKKMLSIPPYISTSWYNIASLQMEAEVLVVTPYNGEPVKIPNLKQEVIDTIFEVHEQFLEEEEIHLDKDDIHPDDFKKESPFNPNQESIQDSSIRFGFGAMDSLGSSMQHNPAQANMPDLPKEVLSKIAAIARILAPEEIAATPQPIANCNCVYCQIAKAISTGIQFNEESGEEVGEEDLQFQQWEISQTGDKLFTVINRLDKKEHYNVYLGQPVGCTCGNPGCEHILAVLKS